MFLHIPVIYVRRDISKQFSANLICLLIKDNDVDHHLIFHQEHANGIDCNPQCLIFWIAVDAGRNQRKGHRLTAIFFCQVQRCLITGFQKLLFPMFSIAYHIIQMSEHIKIRYSPDIGYCLLKCHPVGLFIRNSLKDIYPPGEAQALVRLIMERVCGLSTHQLLLGKGKELSDTEKFKIKEIVEGLRLYKPIQYLLGIADFYGIEFKVTPDVLIPRPETAELVERIITDYRGQAPRILDIGTGSGCIAISLAKHLPKAEVAAVDISPEALAVAEENARLNQVSVSFLELDILSEGYPSFMQGKLKFHVEETKVSRKENKSFTYMKPKSHTEETAVSPIGNFNCIVSNPPYIMNKEKATMEANVLENEPHMALFVPDDDPLLFYRAIARFGQRHLVEGGHLYFEINALCGKETVAMLRQENYTEVELIQDLYGKDRIVKAKI